MRNWKSPLYSSDQDCCISAPIRMHPSPPRADCSPAQDQLSPQSPPHLVRNRCLPGNLNRPCLKSAWNAWEPLRETTLAIGDRLDTDILGGNRAGCRTGLVMSGVTTPAELDQWQPKPDLVADRSLANVVSIE